jgi:hypothetical protein
MIDQFSHWHDSISFQASVRPGRQKRHANIVNWRMHPVRQTYVFGRFRRSLGPGLINYRWVTF